MAREAVGRQAGKRGTGKSEAERVGTRGRGSLRGHPCQPGDGHFAKNFRFVCTRRSEPGGTTNTDVYARHASLSLSFRFIYTSLSYSSTTENFSVDQRSFARETRKNPNPESELVYQSTRISANNDAANSNFLLSLSLLRLIRQIARILKTIERKCYLHAILLLDAVVTVSREAIMPPAQWKKTDGR